MEAKNRLRSAVRGLLGLGIAGFLLWLLFRGTDWAEVGAALREMSPGWLLLSTAALVASCFTRIERFTYVVRAVQPASFRNLMSATQIGFLVNFTIPARVGELVRAVLLARFEGIGLSRALVVCGLDRLADLIGFLAVVGLGTLALSGERNVEIAAGAFGNQVPIVVSSALVQPVALGLGAVVLAALAVLGLLYAFRERSLATAERLLSLSPAGLSRFVLRILEGFIEGMHVFRSRRDLALTLFWTLVSWAINTASLAFLISAFGLEYPWWAPCLMIALIGVFISVPVAPGVIGQYHLGVVAALLLAVPEVEPARAKAMAIVAHLLNLGVLAAFGIYFLLQERIGLRELMRRDATRSEVGQAGP